MPIGHSRHDVSSHNRMIALTGLFVDYTGVRRNLAPAGNGFRRTWTFVIAYYTKTTVLFS